VVAYRAALEVRSRKGPTLDRAITQFNLGKALALLGDREQGPTRLEEAVVAFRAALDVLKSTSKAYAARAQSELTRVEAVFRAQQAEPERL
jgi:hypothetical protein